VLLGEDPRSNACQFEKCLPRLDYEHFVRFVLDFGTSRGSAWRRAHHLAPTRALSATSSALKMWRFFGTMDVFGLTGKTRGSESMKVACVWVGLTTDRGPGVGRGMWGISPSTGRGRWMGERAF
jgi:hypothetical protein